MITYYNQGGRDILTSTKPFIGDAKVSAGEGVRHSVLTESESSLNHLHSILSDKLQGSIS